MKRDVLIVALAAIAIFFPASASAARSLTGTVVSSGHGTPAIAGRSGQITTLRTRAHPRIGARVLVVGQQCA